MPQTVLLTGITGFIAKHIARDLLDRGYHVRGSLRSPSREQEVIDAVTTPDTAANLTFVQLDLTSDDGWEAAMVGVDALMHTASPFPLEQPRDENELIGPAVSGTLRALGAAQAAGVTRVILTASMVTMMQRDFAPGEAVTPESWTDNNHATATPYAKSKTLAEKAAWEFVKEHPEMQLTTIHPGLVTGTPLDEHYSTSLAVIDRILRAKDPMQPDIPMPIVDVADTAGLHIRALEDPTSAGHRIIATDRIVRWPQMAAWLKDANPDRPIRTRRAPRLLLRILALFDRSIGQVLPSIGQQIEVDNSATRERFDFTFIPARDSIVAAGRALRATKTY